MWSPLSNTLVLKEGVGTAGTTVAWTGTSTLTISSVTWNVTNPDPSASPLNELTGLSLSWGGSSFTFAGNFATWFSRRTTYVKEEGVVKSNMTYSANNQVNRPTLLPELFYGVHTVENPPRYLTLTFTVIGEEEDTLIVTPFVDQWSCQIQHDYDANIVAVRYAVDQGSNYKHYLEKR